MARMKLGFEAWNKVKAALYPFPIRLVPMRQKKIINTHTHTDTHPHSYTVVGYICYGLSNSHRMMVGRV